MVVEHLSKNLLVLRERYRDGETEQGALVGIQRDITTIYRERGMERQRGESFIPHLVHTLHKAEVTLPIELIVMLREPGGQWVRVVHETVVEDGQQGGRSTQAQPAVEKLCITVFGVSIAC